MQKLLNNKWFVLAIFALLSFVSTLDRFVIAPLLTPIKADLMLSDQEVARAMMAFTYAYALFGPIFGYFGDRYLRKPFILGALILWSVASLGSGLATGIASLLIWRALVGAGEGVHHSLASSWVADRFSDGHKKIAFTVISIIGPMGYSLALIAGGAIAEHHGWRTAFFISGVPGLILAIILFKMKEPVPLVSNAPGENPAAIKPSWADVKKLMLLPIFLLMTLADTLLEIGRGTASFWGTTYLHRQYGVTNAEAASFWGFAYLFFGLFGPLIGGYAVARLVKKVGAAGYSLWSCIALVLCFITGALALNSHDYEQAKIWYSLNVVFATAGFALHILFLYEVVPANLRGTALAVKVSLTTIAANLVITEVVGALSDKFGLQFAMWTSPAAFLLALASMTILTIMLWSKKDNTTAPIASEKSFG